MSHIALAFIVFTLGIGYASLFEWTVHKYVMHKPVGTFVYPFKAHALTHHHMFRADETYHYLGLKSQDVMRIPMAFWNVFVLVPIAMVPFFIAALLFILYANWPDAFVVIGTGLIMSISYYGAYEYMHWCMHLPKRRRLERSWFFKRLNAHHILHHRNWKTNFNVVLPLADLMFGTLVLKSPTRFKQVRGPDIPDVQPL